MNKLIKITYFGVRPVERNIVTRSTNELTSLLRLDTIIQIDVDPYIVKDIDIKLYRIVTSTIAGRSINSVDAKAFFVPEKTYNKIVSNFIII